MNSQKVLYRGSISPPFTPRAPHFHSEEDHHIGIPIRNIPTYRMVLPKVSKDRSSFAFRRRAVLVIQALLSSVITFGLMMMLLSWTSQTILHLILEF